MKLKPFRAEQLARQARRWTVAGLEAALGGLLDLDLGLKGVPGRALDDAQWRLAMALWVAEHVAGIAPGPPTPDQPSRRTVATRTPA
jgi:DNA polymerase III delta subunit